MKTPALYIPVLSIVLVGQLLAQDAATIPSTPSPAATRTNTAVIPAPRDQDGPKKRYEELNRRVQEAGGSTELVFLGDSITQGWEAAGKSVWKKYYGERKALNLGIGGDRTQHVLWRLDHGNFDGLKPKAVVLMIGTNNSNRDDHSPGEILAGVVAIVNQIQGLSPDIKILVLGIFPRGAQFNEQRGKILQVNQALAKLADGRRIYFLDFGSRLIEADGSISKSIMPDYLHLSEAGYQIWAEAMEPVLSEIMGSPTVSSTPPISAAGQWIWQMKGPNGEEVKGPLTLQVDGEKLTGEFRTDQGRALQIRSGTVFGSKIRFTVIRERPQGGEMTYEMEGTVTAKHIEGEAKATLDARTITVPWSATR